jgi:hypothetical protein
MVLMFVHPVVAVFMAFWLGITGYLALKEPSLLGHVRLRASHPCRGIFHGGEKSEAPASDGN